uniref:Serine protease family S33 putative n=1 Tax=Albugo laibachii Nc14 TaxID=890382 RepID=F0WRD4_9STRA|nr:serine protease family S33 putative [Albugo laibachii Nc14]|eukprot:CCA23897.1 serine protease family S33 putative [Albugo laibachii Nc14]
MSLYLIVVVHTLTQFAVTLGQFVPSSFYKVQSWYPCTTNVKAPNVPMECGTVLAPLCYNGICDSDLTITVGVQRIKALKSSVVEKNVWVLPDYNPALGRSQIHHQMTQIYTALQGTVNVYTMEVRGSGTHGTALSCTKSDPKSRIQPGDVPECAKQITETYGTNLNPFSIHSTSLDIVTFLVRYQSGTSVFLYGVGFGALRIHHIRQYQLPFVTGYLLDSILPHQTDGHAYISNIDQTSGLIGQEYLMQCASQDSCASNFKDRDVVKTLEETLSAADASNPTACINTVAAKWKSVRPYDFNKPFSHILRMLLGRIMLNEEVRTLLPAILLRIHRCDPEDVPVIAYFMQKFFMDRELETENIPLVYDLITFSELWEKPVPSKEVLQSRFTDQLISVGLMYDQMDRYCAFQSDNSPMCLEGQTLRRIPSQDSSLQYTPKRLKTATRQSSASVLLFHGTQNPLALHRDTERYYDTINAASKKLVTFPFGTHNILAKPSSPSESTATSSCGLQIFASYIDRNGKLDDIDTSCTSDLALSWSASGNISEWYLRTPNAFDGGIDMEKDSLGDDIWMDTIMKLFLESNGDCESFCSKDAYQITVICIGVALTLVCLGALILYIRWRSMKRLRDEEQKLQFGHSHRVWSSPDCFMSTPRSVTYM